MMIHISARCCAQLFPQLPCTHKDDIATFGCHPQIAGVRLKVKTATDFWSKSSLQDYKEHLVYLFITFDYMGIRSECWIQCHTSHILALESYKKAQLFYGWHFSISSTCCAFLPLKFLVHVFMVKKMECLFIAWNLLHKKTVRFFKRYADSLVFHPIEVQ